MCFQSACVMASLMMEILRVDGWPGSPFLFFGAGELGPTQRILPPLSPNAPAGESSRSRRHHHFSWPAIPIEACCLRSAKAPRFSASSDPAIVVCASSLRAGAPLGSFQGGPLALSPSTSRTSSSKKKTPWRAPTARSPRPRAAPWRSRRPRAPATGAARTCSCATRSCASSPPLSCEARRLTLLRSNTITDVFKRHGGTPLDTPVFELKEILTGSASPPDPRAHPPPRHPADCPAARVRRGFAPHVRPGGPGR